MPRERRRVKSSVASLIFLTLLLTSSAIVSGQVSKFDWSSTNGNAPLNWNYSSQTEVNVGNFGSLAIKWFFPISLASPILLSEGKAGNGVTAPAIIVNGFVYLLTNFHRLIALDARQGKFLWETDPPLSSLLETGRQDYRDLVYTANVTGKPLVWFGTNPYHIFAINALSGDIEFSVEPIGVGEQLPGNFGTYINSSSHFIVDEKSKILIAGAGGGGTTEDGRGFLRGFDVSTKSSRLLWTTFIIPPQDGSEPDWPTASVLTMKHAWIFDGREAIDLKKFSQDSLGALLHRDWGNFGFDGTRSYAGAGFLWGGNWAIDDEAGIAYVGTSGPGPAWNATYRPGPNLWSDSVLAIDVKTGYIIWGFQTTAHDLWGYDCSWSVVLGKLEANGQERKVVFKSCKNGFLYALDAADGNLLWYFKQSDSSYPKCVTGSGGSPLHDPLSRQDMSDQWACFPSRSPFVQNPPHLGAIDSSVSYDPQKKVIYLVSLSALQSYQIRPVRPVPNVRWNGSSGAELSAVPNPASMNTTVYALNASTGFVKWKHPLPSILVTGGVTVSGGVVYVNMLNGTAAALDENSGAYLEKRGIGGPLSVRPSIGADVDGNELLIFPSSSVLPELESAVPGDIVALGLRVSGPGIQSTTTIRTSVNPSPSLVSLEFIVPIAAVVLLALTIAATVINKRRQAQRERSAQTGVPMPDTRRLTKDLIQEGGRV